MRSIADLLRSRLPLNRKEVYFAATVLPGIICADDFAHFELFLNLLPVPKSTIQAAAIPTANIQFFTEYCLVEAIHENETRDRFPTPPTSHERPDLMILIDGPEPLLIVIEAKLYDGTSEANLIGQMDRQKKNIVDYLGGCWPELRTIHVALLPDAMKSEFEVSKLVGELKESLPSYRREIITWEEILKAYSGVRGATYFHEMLGIAIEKYDDLRGHSRIYLDDQLLGSEIVNQYEKHELQFQMMGRLGGIGGTKLHDDIGTGDWRTQKYQVKKSSEPRPNWFLISEFVNRVKPPVH